MNRPAVAALLLLFHGVGCDRGPRFLLEQKPVREVRHQGYRRDIAVERRGNAVFTKAVFTREGRYLVTAGPGGMRVWDARSGQLLRMIRGSLDGNDLLVADGTFHRMLARRGDVAPTDSVARGLGMWDLRDGSLAGVIPEADRNPAFPVGITSHGEAIVIRDKRIEGWSLDGSGRRFAIEPPGGMRLCEHGVVNSATYNDKQCFELSPSGHWLAITATNSRENGHTQRPYLADLQRGTIAPMTLPPQIASDGAHGFAFSSDERMLAVGTRDGMWVRATDSATTPRETGPGLFIAGTHNRNRFLTPMAFGDHDTRIVALGDQLQVSSFDASSGALIGRVSPPFEDWEGALRVSADGSRAVAYRFVADLLVVIDGGSGMQRGYLCPFFCNRKHNPVEVPYAVSADGKRVATGGRLGAGLWATDADTLIATLSDPALPPLRGQKR